MKCRVLQGFIDKETNKPYEAGAEFECSEARFKDIQSKGKYLSVIAEKTAVKSDKQPEQASKK